MQIHVNCNGQQYGPYTPEELAVYLQQGAISTSDWAWHEGLADWVQISQLNIGVGAIQTVQPAAENTPVPDAQAPTDSGGIQRSDEGAGGVSAESAMERLRRLQRDRMPGSDKASRRQGARSSKTDAPLSGKPQPVEAFDVPEPRQSKGKLIGMMGLGICAVGLVGYSAIHFLSPSGNLPAKVIVPPAINNEAVAKLEKIGAHVTRDQENQISGIQLSSNNISAKGYISAEGWGILVQLRNIQKLELVGCGVDDGNATNLGKLVHLRKLNLSGNLISDKSVGVLQKLTQLQVLNIKNTKVTKKGATTLQAALPDCEIER